MSDMKGIIEKSVGEHNDLLKTLMTDRELLELAAKAVGIEVFQAKLPGDPAQMGTAGLYTSIGHWNPLVDDGDALRLAVKLRMDVEQSVPQDQDRWVCASVAESRIEGSTEHFEDESQRLAATRRAIVRAATSIAKSIP